MFRDISRTPISEAAVGVGSVVSSGDNSSIDKRFLIVAVGNNKVALISNETFDLASDVIDDYEKTK